MLNTRYNALLRDSSGRIPEEYSLDRIHLPDSREEAQRFLAANPELTERIVCAYIANFPRKLAVFEQQNLLRDAEEVQSYIKTISRGDIIYLAYAAQFQFYDSSFRGLNMVAVRKKRKNKDIAEPQILFQLDKGDDFYNCYSNGPLIWKHRKTSPDTLAHTIFLHELSYAVRIKNKRGALIFSDELGSIEDRIISLFGKTLTEWMFDSDFSWMKNYPLVTVAAVAHPQFTEEVVAAGKKVGAEIKVYN